MKAKFSFFSKAILIMALGIFSVTATQAEEIKIGHVSSARIMQEADAVKEADAKIKKEFKKRDKELTAMLEKLKEKAAKYDKEAPLLSKTERAKRQQELVSMDKALKEKRHDFRQDLSQRTNEERAAFGKELEKAIEKVAKEEKLDLIIQDAFYHNPKIDVTDKVLKELNK